MEHTELYHNIFKEHNLDQLYSIVGEELCAIGYVVVKIEIREEKKLRYVFCQIKNKEVFSAEIAFSAMTLGLFVKITSIIPNYQKPFYYLPVIVMCDDYDDRVKGLINRELSIGHELQHIKDILDLIKQYPDYPDRSFKFGINSITEVEDLVESIDFEMFKLFHIEPPAMKYDFENGNTTILIPVDDQAKTIIRYDCDSESEYVGINMYTYIMRIKDDFKAKFANNKEVAKTVDKEIDRALTCYGMNVLGADPISGLAEITRRSSEKILKTLMEKLFSSLPPLRNDRDNTEKQQ